MDLIRGGSLENAIVLTRDGIMNGELRFPDEFGRHKTLDLIGDLALVGRPLLARVVAQKAGHARAYSTGLAAAGRSIPVDETLADSSEEKDFPRGRFHRTRNRPRPRNRRLVTGLTPQYTCESGHSLSVCRTLPS